MNQTQTSVNFKAQHQACPAAPGWLHQVCPQHQASPQHGDQPLENAENHGHFDGEEKKKTEKLDRKQRGQI